MKSIIHQFLDVLTFLLPFLGKIRNHPRDFTDLIPRQFGFLTFQLEKALDDYHRSLGYAGCGYHYYVRRDGRVVSMRSLDRAGAHVRGYNSHSIGIAYEGGLDFAGNPKDTRTVYQRISLQTLVSSLLQDFPACRVVGHRDLSPDLNADGEISSGEWIKSCPCFDVKSSF